MVRLSVSAAFIFLLAATANAQWARPAKSPDTDVRCTGCPDKAANQLTPGYPSALGVYLGRYLDSSGSSDCQQDFRTYRATSVIPRPDLGRIYFQIGSAVFAYDLTKFFERVGAGESLSLVNNRAKCSTQIADRALFYDSFYYAEMPGSGWDFSSGGDGQTRLYGFDIDDQGYVYLATKWYRFGIVKDDRRRDGALMSFTWQVPEQADAVVPISVAALKGSDGHYWALISDTTGTGMNVFDVTDRAHPVKRPNIQRSMYRFAKSSDATRVGIATVDGRFEIYTTDALVSGGAPLFTRSDDVMIQAVATDGTSWFTAGVLANSLVISVYAPSGNGYRKVSDLRTDRTTISTENLRYGSGYLVQTGLTDGSYEMRLFKVNP